MLDLGYSLLKPALFSMDPERAHERVLGMASAMPGLARALTPDTPPPPGLGVDLAGLVDEVARGAIVGSVHEHVLLALHEEFGLPQQGRQRHPIEGDL